MSTTIRPPSTRQVEEAFAALAQARDRLLAEDASMPEDQQLWQDMLEGTAEGDPLAVIDRIVRAAIEAEGMAELAHMRATELAERKARFKRRNEQLRALAFQMLDKLKMKRLERPDFTASVRVGQPRVIITDDAQIPEAMMRVKREPALALIAAALKAGNRIEGATLANGSVGLMIKTT